MNANTNIVLRAVKRTEEFVTETMNTMFTAQKFITNLNDLFATALVHADYEVLTESIERFEIGNGTGYYDPLIHAVFLDNAGLAVPDFSSIAIFDVKTKRRLYLIVLCKGKNIIVHDHTSPKNGGDVRLAKTGGAESRLTNMEPVWTSGVPSDFVNAANLFGFEIDRRSPVVQAYVPKWKTNNWLSQMSSMLKIAPRREAPQLAETDAE